MAFTELAGVGIVKRHPHPLYYLQEGDVCFLVEDTIFRVHKYFFERESKFFRDLFSRETAGDSDGTKPPPQYKLDVTVEEFSALCYIWYNPLYTYARHGKEVWITLLRLATDWGFENVRQLAIRYLQRCNLETVERIEMYKKYKVDEHLLLPSYLALCKSPTLPSLEDAERLTMNTVLQLASAREKALSTSPGVTPRSPPASPDDVLLKIIGEVFDLTLRGDANNVPGEGQVANTSEPEKDVITLREPGGKKNLKAKNASWQAEGRGGLESGGNLANANAKEKKS